MRNIGRGYMAVMPATATRPASQVPLEKDMKIMSRVSINISQ